MTFKDQVNHFCTDSNCESMDKYIYRYRSTIFYWNYLVHIITVHALNKISSVVQHVKIICATLV